MSVFQRGQRKELPIAKVLTIGITVKNVVLD